MGGGGKRRKEEVRVESVVKGEWDGNLKGHGVVDGAGRGGVIGSGREVGGGGGNAAGERSGGGGGERGDGGGGGGHLNFSAISRYNLICEKDSRERFLEFLQTP